MVVCIKIIKCLIILKVAFPPRNRRIQVPFLQVLYFRQSKSTMRESSLYKTTSNKCKINHGNRKKHYFTITYEIMDLSNDHRLLLKLLDEELMVNFKLD